MKNLFLTLFLFTIAVLSAQEDMFSGASLFKGDVQGNINAYTISSSFGEDAIEVDDNNLQIRGYKGSPFLLYKWAQAEVLFNDGQLFKIPLVNYDALSDEFVVYLKNLNKEIKGLAHEKFPLIALDKNNMIAISLKNDSEQRKFVRVTPLRFLDKPKSEFFEYFSAHPKDAYVLRTYYKKVTQNRLNAVPYTDSHETYAFKTFTRTYIMNKNKIFVSTNLGKKNVLKTLGDKAHEKDLKNYIKKNKLKMSHPEDVQALLEYYFKELNPPASK